MKLEVNNLFTGGLFLVFLTLKLLGKITWSWWWVTSPLWIPFVVIGVVGFIIFGVVALFSMWTD